MNITGVRLRREGVEIDRQAEAVVEIEHNGEWVELIREPIGANFDSIVNEPGLNAVVDGGATLLTVAGGE
jgi:hypothetical protein